MVAAMQRKTGVQNRKGREHVLSTIRKLGFAATSLIDIRVNSSVAELDPEV